MCGRYARTQGADDIFSAFDLQSKEIDHSLPLNWNIAPTNEIYIIRGQRSLATASWGLIAPWMSDIAAARASQSHAINARSESIHEKPTFRSAFKSRRCLIPATGYYEWATELGAYKPKQPFYISNKDKSSIAIAGIYEQWINPQTSSAITTAAIITREVVGILKPIHHRMPVILPKSLWNSWLSNKSLSPQEVDEYLKMIDLESADAGLTFWPVADEVNNARNTGAQLAAQIELSPSQTLF